MRFSIVVPCYNVGKYIDECVLSIIKQDYEDFEVILVDDGSTDTTPQKLDSYANMDSRIRVVHKKNGGLTSARKAGTEEARGDYIVPIDGDDWIEEDYLSSVATALENDNIDLVICSYYEANGSKVEKYPIDGETRILSQTEKEDLIYKDLFHFFPNVWAKVYKRELYVQFQMSLDDKIIMGEDGAINFPLIMRANQIMFVKKAVYNYRLNPSSLTKSSKKYVPWDAAILRIQRMQQLLSTYGYDMDNQIAAYAAHAVFTVVTTHINKDGTTKAKAEFVDVLTDNSDIKQYLQKAQKSKNVKEKVAAFLLYHKLFGLIKTLMCLR